MAHSRHKYGATGQTPTGSRAGLSEDHECRVLPVRAPESSSNSTGRHAVTMADGSVLPVDPPDVGRRVSRLCVNHVQSVAGKLLSSCSKHSLDPRHFFILTKGGGKVNGAHVIGYDKGQLFAGKE